MSRARATAGVLLLLAALHGGGAGAQPLPAPDSSEAARREEARTLGYSGVRAFGAGDYATASEQLERSFALLPVPSLGLWSARALVKLSRLVEAEQRYRAVAKMRVAAADSDVQHAARETAQAELLELLPRIPTLRVQVSGARPEDVALTLDGAALPHERWRQGEPVNPGQHQIAGSHAGERVLLDINASEGRESEALLTFSARLEPGPAVSAPASLPASPGRWEPAAELPPAAGPESARAWRLGGWLLVGAAGVSAGASVFSYFLATEQRNELQADGSCQGQRCQPSRGLDRYEELRTVHLVTLVGALALGAGGATILLLEPGAQAPSVGAVSSLALQLGWGSASLRGRF